MLSYFLFGIAAMQLFYGPLSDSIGRRKLLLAGITLFISASLLIPYARDFEQVIFLRILQAIGACAGITLGRAIVEDIYPKEEASRIFLTIFPVVGISPAIAPLIGGQLNTLWGWQACFLFSACFGLILVLLIFGWVPETRTPTMLQPLSFIQISHAYKSLLTMRRFWRYACVPCVAYAAYFLYIAESPFLLQTQGLTTHQISYAYGSLSLTYVIGNLLARKLMREGQTTDQLLNLGYWLFVVGGCSVFLATSIAPHSFLFNIIAMSLLTMGNGFLLPLGTSGAITCIPSLTGSASGLIGALQMASAAIAAQCIGNLSQHQPEKFGIVIVILVISGFILYRWLDTEQHTQQEQISGK